jgi:hypothetical protein
MDALVILLMAGIGMSLFSTVLMAIYSYLEVENKKKEIRRYARQQIIKQMERDKQMKSQLNETVDLFSEEYN